MNWDDLVIRLKHGEPRVVMGFLLVFAAGCLLLTLLVLFS